ncbi:hypothetical protein BT69DRAFT_481807 [Atractiella rhizophila]|nr:hypothetical protein BT69DRAFT_481807 [Atractiella rhizophila]
MPPVPAHNAEDEGTQLKDNLALLKDEVERLEGKVRLLEKEFECSIVHLKISALVRDSLSLHEAFSSFNSEASTGCLCRTSCDNGHGQRNSEVFESYHTNDQVVWDIVAHLRPEKKPKYKLNAAVSKIYDFCYFAYVYFEVHMDLDSLSIPIPNPCQEQEIKATARIKAFVTDDIDDEDMGSFTIASV